MTPPQPTPEPEPAPAAPVVPAGPVLPSLPTEKSATAGVLEERTVVIYGPPKIGKSTLAAQWAGGDLLFFDCAGELKGLDVYRMPVTDWTSFRAACAAYKKEMEQPEPRFRGCVIDTADVLATFCAQHVRGQLGIVHESDAEWGKGWSLVSEQFISHLAKLQALPGSVLVVTHEDEFEITKPNEKYTRSVIRAGAKRVRQSIGDSADLILYVTSTTDGGRVIHTKPGKYHEAGERGNVMRLPAEVPWPFGTDGFQLLRDLWYIDTKTKGDQTS